MTQAFVVDRFLIYPLISRGRMPLPRTVSGGSNKIRSRFSMTPILSEESMTCSSAIHRRETPLPLL